MGVRLFVIERSYVVWLISLERSGVPRATEVLGQEFLDQISPEGHRFMCYLFRLESSCGTYNLVPRGTQMPYSAVVDLVAGLGASQVVSELLVEGPEMAPVAPGIGPGTSIEEDPSEPTSDSEMTPEPEQGAPAVTGSMGTSLANTMPAALSPTPIPPVASVSSFPASLLRGGVREYDICCYCLWREQRAEAASQQWIEHVMSWSPVQDVLVASVRRRSRCWIEYRNMSGSQSPNRADKVMSENSQNRQSEPTREATLVQNKLHTK
ncbi:hypothetical protein M9H77_29464 [Catharanthus roseus]|uniref:Uncharacterized protein n=1 Tax=Catharanthus roseus TaxID=4058 RepID=A0ACB9ZX30_CATRO|nr:hypothetical protein M9H77_29464 [Catharanthus roseus]